jgi:hypothetical protein
MLIFAIGSVKPPQLSLNRSVRACPLRSAPPFPLHSRGNRVRKLLLTERFIELEKIAARIWRQFSEASR